MAPQAFQGEVVDPVEAEDLEHLLEEEVVQEHQGVEESLLEEEAEVEYQAFQEGEEEEE